jgi:hypothetical protein
MSYDIGDVVRCTGTFTTAAGVATDPTAVNFRVKTPAGTVTTYVYGTDAELVKASTGVYYVDVSLTMAGSWTYRFYSTGVGQAAAEATFWVNRSAF